MTFDPVAFLNTLRTNTVMPGQLAHVQTLPSARRPRYAHVAVRLAHRRAGVDRVRRRAVVHAPPPRRSMPRWRARTSSSPPRRPAARHSVSTCRCWRRWRVIRWRAPSTSTRPRRWHRISSVSEHAGEGCRPGIINPLAATSTAPGHAQATRSRSPPRRARAADQPRHAPRRHPAEPPALGRVLPPPALCRHR